MITFVTEYRINPQFTAEFERAYASGGAFGRLFVNNGCSNYMLLKDRHDPRRYVVVHTWSDPSAFAHAQERAAQGSYAFQQQSRGWVTAVNDLEPTDVLMDNGAPYDQFEVLSEY